MLSTPLRAIAVLFLAVAMVRAEPITVVSGVFTVDTTPPSVPVAVTPGDGASVMAPFLRLEASSTDALTGVAGFEFELTGVGLADVAVDYAVFRELSDSTYTWSVRARDAAGNLSDWASFSCTYAVGDDADADGLPDAWELVCFGRLDYTDGSADSDLDGFTDLEEAEANTHGFEFYVPIVAGWNMIALPCDTTADSAAALVAAADSPVWMWDAARLCYETTAEPPARQGLWIYSADDKGTIPVSGTPPLDNRIQLELGWNLTGTGLPAMLNSSAGIRSIMGWVDGAYDVADPADFQFAFLQGYWMSVSLPGQRQLVPVAEQ